MRLEELNEKLRANSLRTAEVMQKLATHPRGRSVPVCPLTKHREEGMSLQELLPEIDPDDLKEMSKQEVLAELSARFVQMHDSGDLHQQHAQKLEDAIRNLADCV